MRRLVPALALVAIGAVALALWPSAQPVPDSRSVGQVPAYEVVYLPPALTEVQDLVDPAIPLSSTPTATWARLRWQRVEQPRPAAPVVVAARGVGTSWTSQGIVTEAPAVPAQTGPVDDVEAADPYKVYDDPLAHGDPVEAEAQDPYKVFDGHEVAAEDPYKVYDDPLTLPPPSTTDLTEHGPSDSELENHAGGVLLAPGAPGATVAEVHVDGKIPPPPGASPTEAGTWEPDDLTNTVLAAAPVPTAAERALLEETLVPPEPVLLWPGDGTDTRQR